jgi:hypothetical protein
MASTERPKTDSVSLSLDDLRKEYSVVFQKVHRIRNAMSQAEVDRLEWANRYREWMMMQKEPESVLERLASGKRFEAIDPYPAMPTPDLEAEKRMAELHHLIAKIQRETSE